MGRRDVLDHVDEVADGIGDDEVALSEVLVTKLETRRHSRVSDQPRVLGRRLMNQSAAKVSSIPKWALKKSAVTLTSANLRAGELHGPTDEGRQACWHVGRQVYWHLG